MGFLSGDDDNQPSQSEQLLNQQIQQNRAELERKKQDLYKTRLDIIKGQGGQNWTPEEPHAVGNGKAPDRNKLIEKVFGSLAGKI